MNLQNQELYNALQQVSSKASMLEILRESLERGERELAVAKAAARHVLEELPSEQVEALMALPIQHGDIIMRIRFDNDDGLLEIDTREEPERRNLHDLMGDEERAAVRQRVQGKLEQQRADEQEDRTDG
ncbi:hypothetical protein [Chromohalobacter israelensis]|uniref:hypothetical protein n=1 Tax=Chromohalobacter israelensis TaxID=141390 RepID=UPI000555673A|nr:hypothetical protein [Chromohalobacter israelensis]MDF9432994.1 hypothetical protein [Chromohalobacter israelensis]